MLRDQAGGQSRPIPCNLRFIDHDGSRSCHPVHDPLTPVSASAADATLWLADRLTTAVPAWTSHTAGRRSNSHGHPAAGC